MPRGQSFISTTLSPPMNSIKVSQTPSADRYVALKGCWPCRYRMKGCKPGPEGRCKDCETFNIRCCGQGIDRPAGTDVKERVRALIKEWISNRANRGPSVPPLDVTRVMPSLLSSPVANPAIHQYSDGTPNSPSWAVIAQHDNTAGPAPSHNHESTIYQYTPLSSSPPCTTTIMCSPLPQGSTILRIASKRCLLGLYAQLISFKPPMTPSTECLLPGAYIQVIYDILRPYTPTRFCEMHLHASILFACRVLREELPFSLCVRTG
ncbi:hypothetical protein BS47DRAFT_599997 [Hydnum rufescens UP504]|uniref:Uncharacterized protein n=1 Tax=Hydnum rufescens UP504 TaxID=1448309 RepID=A0A9P6AGH2_9AGAM|nr:hypothetical protein BS47DRAFT_599997 [Hydnum rufescens UP504]